MHLDIFEKAYRKILFEAVEEDCQGRGKKLFYELFGDKLDGIPENDPRLLKVVDNFAKLQCKLSEKNPYGHSPIIFAMRKDGFDRQIRGWIESSEDGKITFGFHADSYKDVEYDSLGKFDNATITLDLNDVLLVPDHLTLDKFKTWFGENGIAKIKQMIEYEDKVFDWLDKKLANAESKPYVFFDALLDDLREPERDAFSPYAATYNASKKIIAKMSEDLKAEFIKYAHSKLKSKYDQNTMYIDGPDYYDAESNNKNISDKLKLVKKIEEGTY